MGMSKNGKCSMFTSFFGQDLPPVQRGKETCELNELIRGRHLRKLLGTSYAALLVESVN